MKFVHVFRIPVYFSVFVFLAQASENGETPVSNDTSVSGLRQRPSTATKTDTVSTQVVSSTLSLMPSPKRVRIAKTAPEPRLLDIRDQEVLLEMLSDPSSLLDKQIHIIISTAPSHWLSTISAFNAILLTTNQHALITPTHRQPDGALVCRFAVGLVKRSRKEEQRLSEKHKREDIATAFARAIFNPVPISDKKQDYGKMAEDIISEAERKDQQRRLLPSNHLTILHFTKALCLLAASTNDIHLCTLALEFANHPEFQETLCDALEACSDLELRRPGARLLAVSHDLPRYMNCERDVQVHGGLEGAWRRGFEVAAAVGLAWFYGGMFGVGNLELLFLFTLFWIAIQHVHH